MVVRLVDLVLLHADKHGESKGFILTLNISSMPETQHATRI
jgi:hypothetical protein